MIVGVRLFARLVHMQRILIENSLIHYLVVCFSSVAFAVIITVLWREPKPGVHAFAVATIDEGIRLRRYGISGEILILGYTAPARAKDLYKYDLMQSLIDYGYAILLNKQGHHVKTHIKIDTGMHRLGFEKEDAENIDRVFH